MNHNSFLSSDEIANLGLGGYGERIFISRFARLYSPERIMLGNHVRIDDFCVLSGGSGITIGDFVHIGSQTCVFGSGGVVLENYANISSRVGIYSESDDPSGETLTNPMIPRQLKYNQTIAPVHIGEHCIVFTNSTLLPGVTMEPGAVLGAHSLANRNLPAWTISIGNPAKVIKQRKQQLLSQISDLQREILKDTL